VAVNRIPVLIGLEGAAPSQDDLKAFGAAFATTASAPMFHILGETPKAVTLNDATGRTSVPTVDISIEDLIQSWRELDSVPLFIGRSRIARQSAFLLQRMREARCALPQPHEA
jgi:predicted aconitase